MWYQLNERLWDGYLLRLAYPELSDTEIVQILDQIPETGITEIRDLDHSNEMSDSDNSLFSSTTQETTTESLSAKNGANGDLSGAMERTTPKGKVFPETELEKLIVHYTANAKYLTEAQWKTLHNRDISLYGEERITAHELAQQDYRYLIWAKEAVEQLQKKAGRLAATKIINMITTLKPFREWCDEHKREYRAPGEKIDAVSRTGGKSWLEEKFGKQLGENDG